MRRTCWLKKRFSYFIVRRTIILSKHIHTHIYIHTYIHIYIHTYIHTYVHTSRCFCEDTLPTTCWRHCAYIHIYIHIYVDTYMHTYIHTCIEMFLWRPTFNYQSCMYTYMHIYIHTCIYTHTYINTYIHTYDDVKLSSGMAHYFWSVIKPTLSDVKTHSQLLIDEY